jgi:hypothetical protein
MEELGVGGYSLMKASLIVIIHFELLILYFLDRHLYGLFSKCLFLQSVVPGGISWPQSHLACDRLESFFILFDMVLALPDDSVLNI